MLGQDVMEELKEIGHVDVDSWDVVFYE